jgi:hypothetical protein
MFNFSYIKEIVSIKITLKSVYNNTTEMRNVLHPLLIPFQYVTAVSCISLGDSVD